MRSDDESTTWLINTPGGDTDASNEIAVDEIEYLEVEPWNGAITGTYNDDENVTRWGPTSRPSASSPPPSTASRSPPRRSATAPASTTRGS